MQIKATITVKGNVFNGKGPEIVQAELVAGMTEAVAFMEREVKIRTPVGVYGAQGGLLATIQHGVAHGAMMAKGLVWHGKAKYGDVIEKGRTAGKGMPPEGTLLRWIEVKLGLDEKAAAKIEFAVRRKIGKKGFEGAHMFEEGFNEGWPTVQRIFEKRGFEIARELEK